MNDRFYPVFVKGKCLHCLVVGGGKVGVRKIESLIESGAYVTVVSPQGTDHLAELARQARLRWVREPYEERFLQGMQLVIGATDDRAVNERIFNDAKKMGILVNIVDDPEHCTFIVPSVMTKGQLCVAVGTGGAAPKVAAKIRTELEAHVPDEYEVMIDELSLLRPTIKRLTADCKDRFWQTIFSLEVTSYRGRAGALRQRIRNELKHLPAFGEQRIAEGAD